MMRKRVYDVAGTIGKNTKAREPRPLPLVPLPHSPQHSRAPCLAVRLSHCCQLATRTAPILPGLLSALLSSSGSEQCPNAPTAGQIFYNGERLGVKGFSDYVNLYLGDKDPSAKVYEKAIIPRVPTPAPSLPESRALRPALPAPMRPPAGSLAVCPRCASRRTRGSP